MPAIWYFNAFLTSNMLGDRLFSWMCVLLYTDLCVSLCLNSLTIFCVNVGFSAKTWRRKLTFELKTTSFLSPLPGITVPRSIVLMNEWQRRRCWTSFLPPLPGMNDSTVVATWVSVSMQRHRRKHVAHLTLIFVIPLSLTNTSVCAGICSISWVTSIELF
jgi:hypothetical protein